jgi:hypothetical protein
VECTVDAAALIELRTSGTDDRVDVKAGAITLRKK